MCPFRVKFVPRFNFQVVMISSKLNYDKNLYRGSPFSPVKHFPYQMELIVNLHNSHLCQHIIFFDTLHVTIWMWQFRRWNLLQRRSLPHHQFKLKLGHHTDSALVILQTHERFDYCHKQKHSLICVNSLPTSIWQKLSLFLSYVLKQPAHASVSQISFLSDLLCWVSLQR